MRKSTCSSAKPAKRLTRLATGILGAVSLTFLGAGAAHAGTPETEWPTQTAASTNDVNDWG